MKCAKTCLVLFPVVPVTTGLLDEDVELGIAEEVAPPKPRERGRSNPLSAGDERKAVIGLGSDEVADAVVASAEVGGTADVDVGSAEETSVNEFDTGKTTYRYKYWWYTLANALGLGSLRSKPAPEVRLGW
jgi:hypothetical protein